MLESGFQKNVLMSKVCKPFDLDVSQECFLMSEYPGLGDGKEIPCHCVFFSTLGNVLIMFQQKLEKMDLPSFLSDVLGRYFITTMSFFGLHVS